MQKAVKKIPKGDEFRFKKEEFQHGDTLGRQKGTPSRKLSQRRETDPQEHTLREAILETKGSPELESEMRLLWRAGGQRASQKRVQRKLVFHIFRLCCLHIRRPSRILYGKRALILRAGCEHTGVLTRGGGNVFGDRVARARCSPNGRK